MTASKFIITATALSSLLLSASSNVPKPSISSIVASSRSGHFGLTGEYRLGQGWTMASVPRGGSLGK